MERLLWWNLPKAPNGKEIKFTLMLHFIFICCWKLVFNTSCVAFKVVFEKYQCLHFSHIRDVFLVDSNRVSAATVASTAIAAAQWAVTQVWKSVIVSVIFIYSIMRNTKKVQFVFVFNGFIQAAQNGPSGGPGVDTALCQQGAAVSYSQKRNTFSGLDVSSFKPQTDVRVAPIPGGGAALMGTFPAG